VHPELDYLLVSRKGRDHEIIMVAAARIEALGEILGSYTVAGSLKGKPFLLSKHQYS